MQQRFLHKNATGIWSGWVPLCSTAFVSATPHQKISLRYTHRGHMHTLFTTKNLLLHPFMSVQKWNGGRGYVHCTQVFLSFFMFTHLCSPHLSWLRERGSGPHTHAHTLPLSISDTHTHTHKKHRQVTGGPAGSAAC